MIKLLAIGGVPGTGKSTLMTTFMKGRTWERRRVADLVDTEYNEELNIHIIGKYDAGEIYGGTDKLSMAVMPKAVEFLKSQTEGNFIFEGDRLFSYNFLANFLDEDKFDLKIIYLTASKAELQRRYAERGSDQSETFIKGRETKCLKVVTGFDFEHCVETRRNEDSGEAAAALHSMLGFFEIA